MKKTMFALAVLAAGGAMALESANVVGFLNKQDYQYNAMKLVSPCFKNVNGTEAKVTLADINVIGYRKDNGDFLDIIGKNGVNHAVTIARINNNGATLEEWVESEEDYYPVQYFWNDSKYFSAGWYDENDTPMTEDEESFWGPASEIEFQNGHGFRVLVTGAYNKEGQTVPFALTFSGEVVKGDVDITSYTPNAMRAAGNPLPVNIKLSDITVTGYTDGTGAWLPSVKSGVNHACTIARINNNGATLEEWVEDEEDYYPVQYFWNDSKYFSAGWYDENDTPMTEDEESFWGPADQIEYKAGDGFRVLMSGAYKDEDGNTLQMKLHFPGCID